MRRRDVARRLLRNETEAQIAERYGVSHQAISKDVKILEERWKTAAILDFDALKGRELAKLDAVEAELWASWELSKKPRDTDVAEQVEIANPPDDNNPEGSKSTRTRAYRKTESTAGNPAFLQGVVSCVMKRAELTGLTSPKALAASLADVHFTIKIDSNAAPPRKEGPLVIEHGADGPVLADRPLLAGPGRAERGLGDGQDVADADLHPALGLPEAT